MILQEWCVYWCVLLGLLIVLSKSRKLYTIISIGGISLLLAFRILIQTIDEGVSYKFTPIVANTTAYTDASNQTITTYVYTPFVSGTLSSYYTEWSAVAAIVVILLIMIYKFNDSFRRKKK